MRLLDEAKRRVPIESAESRGDAGHQEIACIGKIREEDVVNMQMTGSSVLAVIIRVRSAVTQKLFEKHACGVCLIELHVRHIDAFPTQGFINEPAETVCPQL